MDSPANLLTATFGGTPKAPRPPIDTRECLRWALDYAKHGYRVLPVWWITEHGHCSCPSGTACGKKAGKHPIPSDWQKIGTTDEVQIREWWNRWPCANVALLMGNGICAVDIDNTYALEELNSRGLPIETPTQHTGSGGLHRLYRWTGKKLRNAVRFMEGADIRTDGGIIIVEPSANQRGPYVWEVGKGPFELSLAELPVWIADLCGADNRIIKPPLQLTELWEGIPEGARNGRIFSYACRMRREKRPELEVLSVCTVLGQRCKPAMEPTEIESIVASSGRYAEKRDDDGLICVDVLPDLMEMELSVKEEVISPWLREKDISMVHAWRGIGKTWFTLSLGCSIASGKPFMRWDVPKARGVLVVDGEMPSYDLKRRLAAIIKGQGCPPTAPFRLICHDMQERGIPSLDTSAGQDLIERHLEGISVLILDNASTLFRAGDENESASWTVAQSWLLKLRRMGITVIFIHHSGKGGQQRGTSKREDILDSVISLRRPSDYRNEQGARFEVHFEKARGISGKAIDSFEVMLEVETTGGASWLIGDITNARDTQIIEFVGLNLSQRVIAGELGINQSNVARAIRRLKKEGRL